VKPEDLIEYGFESEFVGRLPVIAVLNPLDENDLYKILKNRHSSVVTAKKQDFKSYGINLRFTDDALKAIAKKAYLERTGARSLVSVIEKTLVGFERRLPSSDVKQFCCDEECVDEPRTVLKQILEDESHRYTNELFKEIDAVERAQILEELQNRKGEFQARFGKSLTGWALESVVDASMRQGASPESMYARLLKVENEIESFEVEFERLYGLKIRFDDDALRELIVMVLNGSEEALIVCRKIFQNYHHGLKLVMERTGQSEFTINKEALANPEKFLNELIQKTYRQIEQDGPTTEDQN
jgi:ATP-dependent Clp protease ATP-binding subunit ClpX